MKKIFTLKNILVFVGTFILLLAFCLSFAVKGTLEGGGARVVFNYVLYGSKRVIGDGVDMDIPEEYRYFAALPVIGYIIALIGGLVAVIFVFVVKKEKMRKNLVLGAAGFALVGAIFSMITLNPPFHAYAKLFGSTYEQAKTTLESIGVREKASALNIVMGIFSILGACAIGASQFLGGKVAKKETASDSDDD